jgi:hypothetical protein
MSQHEQLTRIVTSSSEPRGTKISTDFCQTAPVPGVHEYNGGVYYTVPSASRDSSNESDTFTESEIIFDDELGSHSEQSGNATKKGVFRMHRFNFLTAFLVLVGLSAMTYFLVARNKSSSVDEKVQSGQPLGKASQSASHDSCPAGSMPTPGTTIDSNEEVTAKDTVEIPKSEVEADDVDTIPEGVDEGIETQVEKTAEKMQKPPAISRKQQVVDFVKRHKKLVGGAAATAAVIAYFLSRQQGDVPAPIPETVMDEDKLARNAITGTCDWEDHRLPHCSTSEAREPGSGLGSVGLLGLGGFGGAFLSSRSPRGAPRELLENIENAEARKIAEEIERKCIRAESTAKCLVAETKTYHPDKLYFADDETKERNLAVMKFISAWMSVLKS